MSPRRLLAPIGGTTTARDCLTALRYLVDPHALVDGPAIVEYEREFARRIGVRHAYAFASGRVGLYGVLCAMGIGHGDEVLLQVPTHVVVPNAIRYAGATPVYVDCRPDTYNMDLDEAERRVTPRTRALLIQHTFGIPADVDRAVALARHYELKLIEDCAHALGATYAGRPVGSFGDAAFFSMEEKTISTAMGGMVVTDQLALAMQLAEFQARCRRPSRLLSARYLLKVVLFHLITEPSAHRYTRPLYKLLRSRIIAPGATSQSEARGERPPRYEQRLSNGQAALALSQLRRLDANLAHRELVSATYARTLSTEGFDTPRPPGRARPAYSRYPVCVRDKRDARRAAASRAMLGQWLGEVVDGALPPASLEYEPGSCPRAEALVEHLVNLPTHLKVNLQDAEAIVSALAGAHDGRTSDRVHPVPRRFCSGIR